MRKLEEMTIEEKLGQLIVFGFYGTELSDKAIDLIENHKAGNVILFARNLEELEQTKKLNAEINEKIFANTGILPFISLDQEGGVVSRLPIEANIFPSAMAVRASDNVDYSKQAAFFTGVELKSLGFNVNFAPVLDINNNPQNPVIGVRSYSADKDEVSEYGIASFEGYVDAGVLPVAKHFPGHGDTDVDSHLGLPTVDKSREDLLNTEFVPFKNAIDKGLPAIMNAHILYPAIEENELPATLSKTIMRDIQRDDLGFDGLIFSDCFEMQAISNHYGTPNSFVDAIQAGMDLVLISHTVETSKQALTLALEAVENGSLSIERVDESVSRILRFKEEYTKDPVHVWDDEAKAEAAKLNETISRDSIVRFDENSDLPQIDENTVFIGSGAERSTYVSSDPTNATVFTKFMANEFNAKSHELSTNPDEEEIASVLETLKDSDTVVYGTYNAHLNSGQLNLAEKLHENGKTLVVVALRNPYDLLNLSSEIYKIAAFDYTLNSFAAIADVLKGEEARGVLKI